MSNDSEQNPTRAQAEVKADFAPTPENQASTEAKPGESASQPKEDPIPQVSKRVADANLPSSSLSKKEKEQRYFYQIALVRREVASAKDAYGGYDYNQFSKAINLIGMEQLMQLLEDPQERHHRRLCQGRAAASHPGGKRRQAYVFLSAAPRIDIEKAVHYLKRSSGVFEPSERAKKEITKPKKNKEFHKGQNGDGEEGSVYTSGQEFGSGETELSKALKDAFAKQK